MTADISYLRQSLLRVAVYVMRREATLKSLNTTSLILTQISCSGEVKCKAQAVGTDIPFREVIVGLVLISSITLHLVHCEANLR
jgi:hypothetical protein